ncbi:hypothetical protein ABL699_004801 [Escherichia coli]|nr:hypothetical protein [Escherichia coli]OUK56810.1 hypothetical protein BZL34_25605 [Escherichia coli]HAV9945933.1 hypothetical protein [Escherichia coli]HAW0236666.1 hypothetical protein [Escherichia coli]HAW4029285.1 hypothetical protein [Escherichia coli]
MEDKMQVDIISPVTDPYACAHQALLALIKAGKIENSAMCFEELKELVRLYEFIKEQSQVTS